MKSVVFFRPEASLLAGANLSFDIPSAALTVQRCRRNDGRKRTEKSIHKIEFLSQKSEFKNSMH
jgi:hypothetical protein